MGRESGAVFSYGKSVYPGSEIALGKKTGTGQKLPDNVGPARRIRVLAVWFRPVSFPRENQEVRLRDQVVESMSGPARGHQRDDRHVRTIAMARRGLKAAVEPGAVQFRGTAIKYEVHRSARRRKTVEISIRGGTVRVAAPAVTAKAELDRIVLKRAEWILGKLAAAVEEAKPRRLGMGDTAPLLGENVPLRVEAADVASPTVRLDDGVLRVGLPPGLGEKEAADSAEDAVFQWYRAQAAEHLSAAVDRWWPALGRGEKCRILIRNQKRRWGSCSSGGTIRFNWRLMMLAPDLVDLVVVHELAHLTVMNHSREFWDLVAKHIPDLKERRKRLREAEAVLPW